MLSKWDVHKSNSYNCKFTSTNETVLELAQDIYESMNIDKTKKQGLKRGCVTTTLLNLKYSWDTNRYLRVPLKKNYYSEYPKRYKYPFYSYRIMNGIIKELEKMGKIDLLPGFKNYEDGSGQQTKVAPKEEFMEQLSTIKKDMYTEVEPPELLILRKRNENKNYKDYSDTNQTRKMRRSLVAYNELRQDSVIDLRGVKYSSLNEDERVSACDFFNKFSATEDYSQSNIPLRNPFIYRVFNDGFYLGGRYYGGIESNMPKLLRDKLHIDGEATVEKDFSSMHIRMLYHLNGIDYRDDAYGVVSGDDPELRKLYKLIGLVTINSADSTNAINGIRNEIRNNNISGLLPNLKDETIKTLC